MLPSPRRTDQGRRIEADVCQRQRAPIHRQRHDLTCALFRPASSGSAGGDAVPTGRALWARLYGCATKPCGLGPDGSRSFTQTDTGGAIAPALLKAMRLEDQSVTDNELRQATRLRLVEELLKRPARLWDHP